MEMGTSYKATLKLGELLEARLALELAERLAGDHPEWLASIHINLGNVYQMEYEQSQKPDRLHLAVEVAERGWNVLRSMNDLDFREAQQSAANNLSNRLGRRFDLLGNEDDLHRSTELIQSVLKMKAEHDDRLLRGGRLINLVECTDAKSATSGL